MSKVTRIFSREFMEDNDYPYELFDTEFIESHRWYDVWDGIFTFEGKNYQVSYLSPSTEMQEEDPWSGEEEIVATEVVKLPVVRYEWTPVDV